MKLSCTPVSFARTIRSGEMDLEGFIHFCAEQGCAAIDLLDSRRYPWLWADRAAQVRELPGWLTKAGLRVAALGCGNDFAQEDGAAFAEHVAVVENAIHEAAEVGAPVVRVFGGHLKHDAGMTWQRGFERVLQGLERCLPAAEKAGVVMGLENHGALPGHSYEIAAIIERFSSPWLRCTFDCANFVANNMDEVEDPLRALDRLLPHVAFVHVKDFGPAKVREDVRTEAYVAGEGTVPLRQMLAVLAASGYAGDYSLEYEAGFKTPEREGVARSLDYLKRVRGLLQTLSPQPASAGRSQAHRDGAVSHA